MVVAKEQVGQQFQDHVKFSGKGIDHTFFGTTALIDFLFNGKEIGFIPGNLRQNGEILFLCNKLFQVGLLFGRKVLLI